MSVPVLDCFSFEMSGVGPQHCEILLFSDGKKGKKGR